MALARLVMRRTGNLEEVPDHLHKPEEAVGTRGALEPGLNFCKVMVMTMMMRKIMMMLTGAAEGYSGNPNNALKLLKF